MWEFLKKLFNSNEASEDFDYKLGAEDDDVDARNISFEDVATGLGEELPHEVHTDISHILVTDQKRHGSCVGQAEGTVVTFFMKLEKLASEACRRWLYGRCKELDGLIEQGTRPSVASNILVNEGVPTSEMFTDDNNLPYYEYITISKKQEILDDAMLQKVSGFIAVPIDAYALKKAIKDYKLVTISISVDKKAFPRSGVLKKPKDVTGSHRIVLYRAIGGDVFYFRNSWGKKWGINGDGKFNFDDYRGFLRDAKAYTDIPNEILLKAKTTPFFFSVTLRLGDSNNDVKQLQKKLRVTQSGYFGNETLEAVKAFQRNNGLFADGVVGPKTREVLNTGNISPAVKKVTLEQFCEQVKTFEGWFPGSASYRRNNPGNLRSWATQVRQDKGFAVFATYEDGWKALMSLVRNARDGKSSYYKPDFSLLQFFSVYAPSNDGNYPSKYAQFVAQKLGVGVEYKIRDLA